MANEASDFSSREHRVNELIAAYLQAVDAGQAPDRREWLARYADLAADLEAFLVDYEQADQVMEAGHPPELPHVPESAPSADSTLLQTAPQQEPPQKDQLATKPAEYPSIPGHVILGELGRGGMGVVHKARHTKLNRLVALKMIKAGSHADEHDLARFRIEAEAVAQMQHPNIVQIYEVGEQDGRPYFSLEFVDGGNLAGKLGGTPQPGRQAAELMEKVARAMHAAHQQDIVHRDLKPANVLLANGPETPLGQCVPKITDFGLAKRLDREEGQTHSGDALGTPAYMAPEQALGQRRLIGPVTDVWALGVILYEMLTGGLPFKGETAWDTLGQVVSQEPVPPSRLQPKVPHDLETICLKCLQKDAQKRYASAEALADDLRRFLAGEQVLARPTGQVERLWRWCRRRPAVAAFWAVLLMSVLAISGLGISRYRAISESYRANRERLRESRLQEATALLGARELGWRERALSAVREAASIRVDTELRDTAVQALIQSDLQPDLQLRNQLAVDKDASATVLAMSPEGEELAAAIGTSIRLWDLQTGTPRARLTEEGQGSVICLAYSPDGRLLASASEDGVIRLWERRSGVVVQRINPKGPVQALAFGPGPSTLAYTDGDSVFVQDLKNGKVLCEPIAVNVPAPPNSSEKLRARAALVTSIKGSFVIAANSRYRHPVMWKFTGEKLTERKELPLRTGANVKMTLTADESRLILAFNVGEDGGEPPRIMSHEKPVEPMPAARPVSPIPVLYGHSDLALVVVEALPRGVPAIMPAVLRATDAVGAVMRSGYAPIAPGAIPKGVPAMPAAHGATSAVPAKEGVGDFWGRFQTLLRVDIYVYDLSDTISIHDVAYSNQPKDTLYELSYLGKVQTLAVNRDGLIFVAGDTGVVGSYLITPFDGLKKIATWNAEKKELQAATFGPTGGQLVTARAKNPLKIWTVADQGLTSSIPPRMRSGPPYQYGYEHAQQVLAVTDNYDIELVDFRSGESLGRIWVSVPEPWKTGQKRQAHSVVWSHDRKSLLFVGPERLHSAAMPARKADSKVIHSSHTVLAGGPASFKVVTLATSLDGRWLALGGQNPSVVIRQNTGPNYSYVCSLEEEGVVGVLAFGKSEGLLATATDKGRVSLWRTGDWKKAGQLPESNAKIFCLAFSPDERFLAVGKEDGTVVLWDVQKQQAAYLDSGEEVWTLSFSPDGSYLVTGGGEGTISLWRVDAGERLTKWRGAGGVMKVFHPTDQHSFISCSVTGEIQTWHVNRIRTELQKLHLDW
jgi:WD40 repeat protein/tRNA A-37 threonylcarbamoyl transferase component Bud32